MVQPFLLQHARDNPDVKPSSPPLENLVPGRT
jgi:hypothetical protein